jgi:DnaK suppressor protein
MTQEELKKFKKGLEDNKREIEELIAKTPLVEDMGSDTEGDSFDQEADEAEAMVNNNAIRTTLQEKLKAIDKALEKIDQGVYGKCETCSCEMDKETTEATPESSVCKSCK